MNRLDVYERLSRKLPKKEEKNEVKRKMKRKTLPLFLAIVMATSLMGVAYAHWSDEIHINGKVEMGSLTFGFTEVLNYTDGKMKYWNSVTDYEAIKPEPKDVGTVVAYLERPEFDVHSNKTVYKKLWVNMTNAYPEYVVQVLYTLDNGGTIPLDVTMYCVVINTTDGLTYGWEDTNNDTKDDAIVARNAAGEAVINIWFEPFFFGQIDPCTSKEQEIVIHIKEPAEQCHTYMFDITIHASQWDP